jgi:hypothetical protein
LAGWMRSYSLAVLLKRHPLEGVVQKGLHGMEHPFGMPGKKAIRLFAFPTLA